MFGGCSDGWFGRRSFWLITPYSIHPSQSAVTVVTVLGLLGVGYTNSHRKRAFLIPLMH